MVTNIPEKLTEHIRKEAEKADCQVVNISTRGGASFFIEVILDKEGGITLDECGEFNRKISSWVNRQNIFGGKYTIDVCSPGLDRGLKSEDEFSWAVGKNVKVTTYEPVDGSNVIIGKLVEMDGDKEIIVEKEEGDKVRVERKNVSKAKLHVVI
ncbi:MAG: ribosome maturation factor RimP [Candidatus Omnitrophota bacterium]